MSAMPKPTRYYSKKQEDKVAKTVSGKRIANSGATAFSKGDVSSDKYLFECKTCTTPKDSMSVKKEWLTKTNEEAFAMRKEAGIVVIDFGSGDNYYILPERLFIELTGDLEK